MCTTAVNTLFGYIWSTSIELCRNLGGSVRFLTLYRRWNHPNMRLKGTVPPYYAPIK